MHKVARILKIHTSLSFAEPPRSAQQWSRVLGVNVRTVLRDLAFLRDELKAPVEFDPRLKGYKYSRANFDFMPENKLSKWTRLLTLIHKIYAEPGKTAKELGEISNCSERTIFRDLEELQQAGFPLYNDKGYRFAADAFLPALNLTPSELFALFVSVSLLDSNGGNELAAESRRGLEKLLRVTSENRRLNLGALGEMVQVTQVSEDTGASLLGDLQQALSQGRQLAIDYQGMKDDCPQERRLDPMGLFCFRQVWYLHAYDHERQGLRNFRLSRVSGVRVLSEPVKNEARLELEAASYHRWDLEGAKKVEVVIKVSDSLCRWLEENPAHPSQRLVEGKAFYQVSDPQAMARWLMSLYGYEVLSPVELRTQLAELGKDLWDQYGVTGRLTNL